MSRSFWKNAGVAALFTILAICDSRVSMAKEPADMAREIASTLREMQAQGRIRGFDLEVVVAKKIVTVTGSVVAPSHARIVMDAILGAGEVEGIVLNIGIGKKPAVQPFGAFPNYPYQPFGGLTVLNGQEIDLSHHQKLEWNDGYWELDFSENGRVKVKDSQIKDGQVKDGQEKTKR